MTDGRVCAHNVSAWLCCKQHFEGKILMRKGWYYLLVSISMLLTSIRPSLASQPNVNQVPYDAVSLGIHLCQPYGPASGTSNHWSNNGRMPRSWRQWFGVTPFSDTFYLKVHTQRPPRWMGGKYFVDSNRFGMTLESFDRQSFTRERIPGIEFFYIVREQSNEARSRYTLIGWNNEKRSYFMERGRCERSQ